MQARKSGADVTLVGEARAPASVLADLAKIRAEQALLDGVLVALDEHERPSQALLAERLSADGAGVVFYAFDLLHFEDYDLRPLPTLERKAALRLRALAQIVLPLVMLPIGVLVAVVSTAHFSPIMKLITDLSR